MFFWVIITCHAEWSECSRDPQPNFAVCSEQAEQININTDAIAVCTARSANVIIAPEAWAITVEAPNDR